MRPNKVLLSFVVTILFAVACSVSNSPQPTFTITPTQRRIVTPTPTQAEIPTQIPDYPVATPLPAWVTDFADPILESTASRKPDFQDDFSSNRKWFNVVSGYFWPLYEDLQDGKLFLTLPEKTKDSILYNSRINRTNFVLTLELRFVHNQPDDTVRFQFDQSPDQSIAFDFSNNRNWEFHWGSPDSWQSVTGIYEHFPPEHILVTIIMRGTQCAVYLDNDPLTYLSNCRVDSISQPHGWITSFRLLRNTKHAVTVNFDNLKLWDLDNIPRLP